MQRLAAIFFLLVLLGVALASAQPVPPAEAKAPPLPQTMTLVVKGYAGSLDVELDFSLAVSGPDFYLRTTVENPADKANKINVVFKGTVKQAGPSYQVEYSLACRVPFVSAITSQIQPGKSLVDNKQAVINYRNIGVEGSVLLQDGRPVTIAEEKGRKLTISLSKAAENLPTRAIIPIPPKP